MIDTITYRAFIFALITLLFSSEGQEQVSIELRSLNSKTNYIAGTPIELKVVRKGSTQSWPLLISSSYGKVVVRAVVNADTLTYQLPKAITHKKGFVNWTLLSNEVSLNGTLEIISTGKATEIETYLGPPSIIAGGADFSMQVAQPVDDFDNPLEDGTLVNMNYQFSEREMSNSIALKNSMAFKRIYSPLRTGRIVALSSMQDQYTAEYILDIVPGLPTDFEVSFDRVHPYADGNQICTFKTSVIVDSFNNKIADGTMVNFVITTDRGTKLVTYGSTIDGVAQAALVHPEFSSSWLLTAFIPGMAKSSPISMVFKPAISDFTISSQGLNQLIVGPIRSFMNQNIPDGFKVHLSVIEDQNSVLIETATVRKGFVYFNLPTNRGYDKKTIFMISAGDLTKEYSLKNE